MKKSAILFLTFLTFIFQIIGLFGVYHHVLAKEEKVIYIDPGHGGFDGGATSINKETLEKDITLDISKILAYYLEQTGYKVILTRDNDSALASTKSEDIYKRVKLINESNCLLYISIHANSYPSGIVKGAQTFYKVNQENSEELAKNIMEMLKIVDPYNNRQAKSISGKYLIDKVNKVGCLVEVGFLTNNEELNKLKNKTYQENIAYAVYLGILKYLGNSGDN
ncbi:MAG: N-acetylmuramoyl-L-alanine amidase [Bacilli bacterium]|nr:N-acetylmuramoyl-L-alanine amidase [Bacilli bacterium]